MITTVFTRLKFLTKFKIPNLILTSIKNKQKHVKVFSCGGFGLVYKLPHHRNLYTDSQFYKLIISINVSEGEMGNHAQKQKGVNVPPTKIINSNMPCNKNCSKS